MLKEWLTFDEFPEARVLCRPFNGPQMFDLQFHGLKGQQVYDSLRFCLLDWENIPLLAKGVSEKFDPAIIDSILPQFALQVVTEVSRRMSSVSEEERKN
jgi:hypothetical protein